MEPDGRRDDHRAYDDMAVAHVMGDLDEYEGRVFRAHLLDCHDCRARVGELRAIAHELAGVERDEQRVRSAKAVEMKSRADGGDDTGESEDEPAAPRRAGMGWVGRVLVLGTVALLVLLGAYVFTLRGQIATLQREVDLRVEASAALEHGRELSIIHTAPGVEDATVKRHGETVVVLLDGLEDERVYGLYLVDDSGPTAQTVYRQPRPAENGRLFELFRLDGEEDRFIVTRPSNGFGAEPSGATVFEAHLDRFADE
jgi:hypothetical protein